MNTIVDTHSADLRHVQAASWAISVIAHLGILATSLLILRGCDSSLPGGDDGDRFRTVGLRVESAVGDSTSVSVASDSDLSSNDQPAADRTGETEKESQETFDRMLDSVMSRTSPLDQPPVPNPADSNARNESTNAFESLPLPDTFGPGMLLTPNSAISGMPSGSVAPLLPGGGGLTGSAVEQMAPGAGRTTFMDVADAGESFVYVIDVSSSMRGGKMRYAREQLGSSLSLLRPDQSFQVILYSSETRRIQLPTVEPRDLYAATTVNTRLASNMIALITPNGGTDHAPALQEALRVGADVIFFMTDGDEPPMDPRDLRAVRDLNRHDARIHVIEFGDDSAALGGTSWLQLLARQNGGAYRFKNVAR